jgi:hypothetical protein
MKRVNYADFEYDTNDHSNSTRHLLKKPGGKYYPTGQDQAQNAWRPQSTQSSRLPSSRPASVLNNLTFPPSCFSTAAPVYNRQASASSSMGVTDSDSGLEDFASILNFLYHVLTFNGTLFYRKPRRVNWLWH